MPPKKSLKPAAKKAKKNDDADEDGEQEDVADAIDNTEIKAPDVTDIKIDTRFATFLDSLPKHVDVVRFFDRKEKNTYVVHDENAKMIAEQYNKTHITLRYLAWPGRADKMPTQGVSYRQFAQVVTDLLLNRGYKVEVYSKGDRGDWLLVKQGSPGNLGAFEELASDADPHLMPVMSAMRMANDQGNRLMGVAYVDTTNFVLGYGEFLDNDQYTNLESFLVQSGAKECLFEKRKDNDLELKKLKKLFELCEVAPSDVKSSLFGTGSLEQDLRNILRPEDHPKLASLLERRVCVGALAALITHERLVALTDADKNQDSTLYRLVEFNLADFVRLDAAALRALNLLPAPGEANKAMSLYGVLNKCLTPMGSRRLLQWIKQPLVKLFEIEHRLNLVEIFKADAGMRKDLQTAHLKRMPDLMRIVKKFHQKKATLADCVRMYEFALHVPELRSSLQSYTGPHEALLASYIADLDRVIGPDEPITSEEDLARLRNESKEPGFKPFIFMIQHAVDLEAVDNHEYVLRPTYDPKLGEIREQIEVQKKHLRNAYLEAMRDLGLDEKRLKLEPPTKALGYHLRVSRKDEQQIRAKLKSGYTSVGGVQKDGLKFVSARLEKVSNEITALTKQYENEQQRHVDELLNVAGPYSFLLEIANHVIADLDVFQSLAQVAEAYNYVRPRLTPMGVGDIRFARARHPCLDAADDVRFTPNDVHLKRATARFQIITGPNMGGKSTFIRMASLLVIMAQIGSFVPASEAEVSIIDCVLARVGAGDNQLRGVSTFMAEMLETASILKSATENSLVVIDELGRGTSTYDGFGLAWAISEYICTNIKAFCFFATHFHELTELADRPELRVANLHVKATTEGGKLHLWYTVEPGPCDQSFGIHVAEMANFPPSVVELAKRKAEELEHFDDRSKRQAMSKEEQAEGEKLLNAFLTKFAALPLNSLAAAEATERINALKRDLAQSNNPYVTKVLRLAG